MMLGNAFAAASQARKLRRDKDEQKKEKQQSKDVVQIIISCGTTNSTTIRC